MNRRTFLRLLAAGAIAPLRPADAMSASGGSLTAAARRVSWRVLAGELPRRYSTDIALQEILRFSRASAEPALGEAVVALTRQRGWEVPAAVQLLPFCNLPLELYHHTGRESYRDAFLHAFRAAANGVQFSTKGAVLHPKGRFGTGHAMLIDGMQEYASRLAWCEQLSGATDGADYGRAVRQFTLYRDALRDPATGLWSNARGWLDDRTLNSPSAWSRGHGWLTRGMLNTIAAIPPDRPEHRELAALLEETLRTLMVRQRPDGWYPCLLDLPASESPREASGSALIAAAMAIAVRRGLVTAAIRPALAAAAQRTFARLPECVTALDEVTFVSPGPGPLLSTAAYRVAADFGPDPHGDFALLSAATSELNDTSVVQNALPR